MIRKQIQQIVRIHFNLYIKQHPTKTRMAWRGSPHDLLWSREMIIVQWANFSTKMHLALFFLKEKMTNASFLFQNNKWMWGNWVQYKSKLRAMIITYRVMTTTYSRANLTKRIRVREKMIRQSIKTLLSIRSLVSKGRLVSHNSNFWMNAAKLNF